MGYQKRQIKAPRLRGKALTLAAKMLETSVPGASLREKSMRDFGIEELRARDVDAPLTPLPDLGLVEELAAPWSLEEIGPRMARASGATLNEGYRYRTVADFASAYREGRSVLEIAERIADAQARFDDGDPKMGIFIARDKDDLMAQARESQARHARGEALSVLDGVPVAVKDELDQVPYPTTVGTRFMGKSPASADATVVAHLRAAGALLIGKCNMHEIGIGVTGLNPHHGVARNPQDPGLHTGGSSSGSAAAVAAGLCPVAVGADGGGSIRTPAAFCGVTGLKATYRRVSEHGAAPLCWSVAHVGPIAGSARDCAVGYLAMSGADPSDRQSMMQPPTAAALEADDDALTDLDGVKVGFDPAWIDAADDEVAQATMRAIEQLVVRGAERVELDVEDLATYDFCHLITIASEMATAHENSKKSLFGGDSRMALAIAESVRAIDYVKAQQMRGAACRQMRELESRVDLIMTPTCGCTAPRIDEADLPGGFSDLTLLDEIMRFVRIANFTGRPSISFPGGTGKAGAPIGVMAMGAPWTEGLLLRVALACEDGMERPEPKVCVDLLRESGK